MLINSNENTCINNENFIIKICTFILFLLEQIDKKKFIMFYNSH